MGIRSFPTMLLSAIVCAACAHAEPPVTSDTESINKKKEFVRELQSAVANAEIAMIADMIRYPISVEIYGTRRVIATRDEFMRAYADIFTPRVKAAIECQRLDILIDGQYGVGIGQGELWIEFVDSGDELKVYRINNEPWPDGYARDDQQCFLEALRRQSRTR